MVDGDTVFEPESLGRLVQPFADPQVGAGFKFVHAAMTAMVVGLGVFNAVMLRGESIREVILFPTLRDRGE